MNTEEYVLVQYAKPPAWLEWLVYVITVVIIGAYVIAPSVYYLVLLASGLMYWNYRMFRIVTEFVRYRNASEFSKMLDVLASYAVNDTEDGTIPVQESLTKESDDESERD